MVNHAEEVINYIGKRDNWSSKIITIDITRILCIVICLGIYRINEIFNYCIKNVRSIVFLIKKKCCCLTKVNGNNNYM